MTNQWLFDRYSFGRPLASYQALKHRAADMKMWFEASRATTAGAVAAVADRAPDAPKLVSVAKAYVAERAPVMLQDCVQMHGGIGVTWEHDLHLYLRRVALYRAMFGIARRPPPCRVRAEQEDGAAGAEAMTDTAISTSTTESVADFAARARAWLAENMPRCRSRHIRRSRSAAEAESWEHAKQLQKRLHDRRLRRHLLPARIRRAGPGPRLSAGVRRRGALLRDAADPERPDVRHLRRDDPRHGQRRPEARPHLGRDPRRRGPGAAAERAQRRVRPRRCHHPGRPRRR